MLVSAYWHGVHAGYYLSFITIPLSLIAEDLMISSCRRPSNERVFDWVCWFFKMRAFDYMCMAFLLLDFNDTVRYWRSTYFIGHAFIAFFIITGLLCQALHVFPSDKTKVGTKPLKPETLSDSDLGLEKE